MNRLLFIVALLLSALPARAGWREAAPGQWVQTEWVESRGVWVEVVSVPSSALLIANWRTIHAADETVSRLHLYAGNFLEARRSALLKRASRDGATPELADLARQLLSTAQQFPKSKP